MNEPKTAEQINVGQVGRIEVAPRPFRVLTKDEVRLVDIVQKWIVNQHEMSNGPRNQWTEEQKERFYIEFGLLYHFASDCWPKEVAR